MQGHCHDITAESIELVMTLGTTMCKQTGRIRGMPDTGLYSIIMVGKVAYPSTL